MSSYDHLTMFSFMLRRIGTRPIIPRPMIPIENVGASPNWRQELAEYQAVNRLEVAGIAEDSAMCRDRQPEPDYL